MFSWVLHDKTQDRVIAARDPIGITTFYMADRVQLRELFTLHQS